jgi:hypothetical protein
MMEKKISSTHFLFVLLVIFYFLGFFDVLHKRPESVHVWAQCDRASVARNYAEESMNFFKPRTNFTEGGTGITGLEFPFMNYIAAICYKLFGFSEFWYRLLMLISITTGLIGSFQISNFFLKSTFLSALVVLSFFLSPVLNYYCANFLPDTASLGFILLTWFCFFKYVEKPTAILLALFFAFGALAALIKITSLISLISILILLICDKLKCLNVDRKKIFSNHFLLLALILIIYILVVSWYVYANWLSKSNNCSVFLMSNKTPNSFEEIRSVWDGIRSTWTSFYYSIPIYYLILITGLSLIVFYRKVNRLTGIITLLLWTGNICFIILMFNQFRNHDYYIITLLPAVFFQFIAAFELYFRIFDKKNILLMINIVVIMVVIYSVFYSAKHQRWRYDKNSWLYSGKEYNDYFYLEHYLHSLGITRESKVVSMYDLSFNITLYAMNVKGWRANKKEADNEVLEYASKGAEFIALNDSSALNHEKLKPLFENKIGQFKNILIFKITK